MKYNPNKTISAQSKKMIISYTDSNKHRTMPYENKLRDIQLYGKKHKGETFQKIGTSHLEFEMQKEYRRAIYGLGSCTPAEIASMSFTEQRKLTILQSQVQLELNSLKEEVTHNKIGSFLCTFFHRSEFAMALAHYEPHVDEDNTNTLQFKELGITKEMIIERLVGAGLLSQTFKKA